MVRYPLPLVALMGAMGCTQDASAPGEAPADDTSLLQRLKGEDSRKGANIRALSPEERESLFPKPIPVPEGWHGQEATAAEPQDGGSTPEDYAEQRRQLYAQRLQQQQEDAALRDAGIERPSAELMAEEALLMGPEPKDIAGQRRLQRAKERLFKERNGGYGKGNGLQRREIIQIIRSDNDGGTTAAVRE